MKFKGCCRYRQPDCVSAVTAEKIKEAWGRLISGKLLIKPPDQAKDASKELE